MRFTTLLLLTPLAFALLPIVSVRAEEQAPNKKVPSPIVVELFTSEGCSSCPPADALLREIAAKSPVEGVIIIPLSIHVDYFNYLGWADPFSSAENSNRQSIYANRFGQRGNYTPEMVVNGRTGFVGSDTAKAREAIRSQLQAPQGELTLRAVRDSPGDSERDRKDLSTANVTIDVAKLPALPANDRYELVLVITEDGLGTDVPRGENANRRLDHTAVVRKLDVLGEVPAEGIAGKVVSVKLDKAWKAEAVKIVVFVQARKDRAIVAAASVQAP